MRKEQYEVGSLALLEVVIQSATFTSSGLEYSIKPLTNGWASTISNVKPSRLSTVQELLQKTIETKDKEIKELKEQLEELLNKENQVTTKKVSTKQDKVKKKRKRLSFFA